MTAAGIFKNGSCRHLKTWQLQASENMAAAGILKQEAAGILKQEAAGKRYT
jgi:hypothetical protein